MATARYNEELNRSRELLIGILGHDMRTPLGAILMSSQVMLELGQLDDRSAAAAQRIQNSAEHIEDLISTLLDATRMRLGGTLPVTPGPSDLSEICTQVVEEVKTAYPAHPIELNTSGNLQGVWDHARLDQMLSNLLANAVQHGA
ncbi:MAG: HAMP domain-containing sensor histidine kinase [Natronospirillum sp.]